jgi:hypothetical protein
MRRGPATLACLAAGAALVIGLPGPAHAATGTFRYLKLNGAPAKLTNPASGQCHNVQGVESFNETDAPAVLFGAPGCQGPTYFLPPGGEGVGFDFSSVKFLR